MQAATRIAEAALGEKEEGTLATGTATPATKEGKTMHAIVWHKNYDVRCVRVCVCVCVCIHRVI